MTVRQQKRREAHLDERREQPAVKRERHARAVLDEELDELTVALALAHPERRGQREVAVGAVRHHEHALAGELGRGNLARLAREAVERALGGGLLLLARDPLLLRLFQRRALLDRLGLRRRARVLGAAERGRGLLLLVLLLGERRGGRLVRDLRPLVVVVRAAVLHGRHGVWWFPVLEEQESSVGESFLG